MFMAEEPPLVSCTSQRSDRPSFQARSTAASGASENEATAMPSIVARVDLGVLQRGDHGVADEGVRRLPRLRAAGIGRLSHADDGGVHAYALLDLFRLVRAVRFDGKEDVVPDRRQVYAACASSTACPA